MVNAASLKIPRAASRGIEPPRSKSVIHKTKKKSGPDRLEIVEALFGMVQVEKLNNDEMVVLREDGDKLNLELAPLP